ncbi:MAG: hypothetical protein ABIW47_17265 [Ginsengibacter sp.]|jgi:hypothetical protein
MYREFIIPTDTHQVIELPEEFIGREVEIIAFPVETKMINKHYIEEAFKFWKENSIDMTNFKFDRIEANER